MVATDVVPNHSGPSWSPDSRHILYVKHDDTRFNPVMAAPVRQPSQAVIVPTGTVGNDELSVVRRSDGKFWIALTAQGKVGDKVRDFRRIYAMALGVLP